jgi:hypothetical protein
MHARNDAIDRACAEIGRDPETIIRSLYGWPKIIGADPWESVDAFHDVVGRYREAGLNEFIFEPPRDGQWAMMEQIAADVIPGLRSGAERSRA